VNKQNREGIGKMPPAPKVSLPNDFNKAVPPSGQPVERAGNLRKHNGKTGNAL